MVYVVMVYYPSNAGTVQVYHLNYLFIYLFKICDMGQLFAHQLTNEVVKIQWGLLYNLTSPNSETTPDSETSPNSETTPNSYISLLNFVDIKSVDKKRFSCHQNENEMHNI